MTGPKSKERVREEARAWVRKLRDVHTAADKEAHEQWLSEDPARPAVYKEVSDSIDRSGLLRVSEIGRQRDLDSAFSRPNLTFGYGLALATIAGFVLVGGYELRHQSTGLQPVALESAMLSSGEQARDVTLADGSSMSMAPASEVRIDLSRTERRAQLSKGRVRLRIAHEMRPFRIAAGASSAEASAGVFDAAMVNGKGIIAPVAVHPVEGGTNAGRERAELSAPGALANQQTLEFSSVPLGQAIGMINQTRGGRRIVLDPSLADLRVTGVFQHGDAEAVARSLALAFGLRLTSTASGALLLTR